jgi:adenylyltransferase/sulfurtransferase
MGEVPEGRPVVVYCRTGQRSYNAAGLMREAGWTDVSNLRGGIVAWAREIEPGLPVV